MTLASSFQDLRTLGVASIVTPRACKSCITQDHRIIAATVPAVFHAKCRRLGWTQTTPCRNTERCPTRLRYHLLQSSSFVTAQLASLRADAAASALCIWAAYIRAGRMNCLRSLASMRPCTCAQKDCIRTLACESGCCGFNTVSSVPRCGSCFSCRRFTSHFQLTQEASCPGRPPQVRSTSFDCSGVKPHLGCRRVDLVTPTATE